MIDLEHIRRQLHEIPELAFQEKKTKAYVLKTLKSIIPQKDHTWKIEEFKHSNGLLVSYRPSDTPFRLFRADMDALPIPEDSGAAYASHHAGLMHACGHDVHMTILLGLISRVVESHPSRNLLFLFQPAEEGQGGAQSILNEGLIQQYDIASAYALHVASEMPVGKVSSRSGVFFGIPQEFDVLFTGQAAHAAFPEKGKNALSAGREFLKRMERAASELQQNNRLIFHVGKFDAGTIRNIIPDFCKLEGTHRTLSPEIRDKLNTWLFEISSRVAEEHGVTAKVDLLCTYDPVVNDPELVETLAAKCYELGLDFTEAETAMTGEDFGFFTTLYPGLLFWLGSGCDQPLHSGKFLPDPACIEPGVKLMFKLASE